MRRVCGALGAFMVGCFALVLVRELPTSGGALPAPSFTVGQSRAGQSLFYANCAECHGAELQGQYGPALAGSDGNLQWQTIKKVYAFATTQMPFGNAGGLPREEYVDIMAFLMQSHGHPAGTTPLTAAAAAGSLAKMGPQ